MTPEEKHRKATVRAIMRRHKRTRPKIDDPALRGMIDAALYAAFGAGYADGYEDATSVLEGMKRIAAGKIPLR